MPDPLPGRQNDTTSQAWFGRRNRTGGQADNGTPHRRDCLTVTRAHLTPPPNLEPARPDEWVRQLDQIDLTTAEKGIAIRLALYANKRDGRNARPGNSRLAWATGANIRTVQRTLQTLQTKWLIYCAGCTEGRGAARIWCLTTHDHVPKLYGMSFPDWAGVHTGEG